MNVSPYPTLRSRFGWLCLLFALMFSPATGRAQTSTVQYLNGQPTHMSNELLISFGASAVLTKAVDNDNLTSGTLDQFVSPGALTLIQQRTGASLGKAATRKIFPRMHSGDSLSVARTGDTVRVFPFWATFSVSVNAGSLSELEALGKSLRSASPTILEVSPNHLFQVDGNPKDLLFQQQYSLYPNTVYPRASINLADNPSLGV
ncbi:MAG: hypothetical protein H7330_09760 [Hymenobacteraceae bacterium]|nr:hypothetical protein [Hymenobacteraceae bacterium]